MLAPDVPCKQIAPENKMMITFRYPPGCVGRPRLGKLLGIPSSLNFAVMGAVIFLGVLVVGIHVYLEDGP
jgi:hypothetical protein